MKRPVRKCLLLFLLLLLPLPAVAVDFSLFKDPEDGMLDVSGWLLSQTGFLPVPIVVTEPAVGYGGGLAVAFFHEEVDLEENPEEKPLDLPPSISVGVGLATENGSWVVGGGHLGNWQDDQMRYTGFAGLASLNLDYYAGDKPFSFNIEGFFLLQELKYRIGNSDFFLGGSYTLMRTEAGFDVSGVIPGVETVSLDSRNAGVTLIGYYDSRDNTFTPNRGQQIELKLTRFDEIFGGNFDYWNFKGQLQSFHQIHPRLVLGVKLEGETVSSGAPFYGLPFIGLRGIQAMRYQGDRVAEIEAEARWAVTSRWSLVGFGGTGWTETDDPLLNTDDDIYAGGIGFRYLMARLLNMHAGIDIAQGPEQTVIYLQAGSAW